MKRQLAIHALLNGPIDQATAEGFVESHEFPLIEGQNVTFVYRGEADEVNLRHWVYGLGSAKPLSRVEGTDLWQLVFSLPARSRMEYKLEVRKGDSSRWIMDPLNSNFARDPFGANSVAQGEGYEIPEWSEEHEDTRPGSLEPFNFNSRALGEVRSGHLYIPARFRRNRRYPLMVVHDGSDYLRYSKMKEILDNLIHRLEIPEMIVAFVDSPDRLKEYADDERHARFLTEELIPDLTRRLPLDEKPRMRCLMGASFGAVASFSTAFRYPDFYGHLVLQSGSFAYTDVGDRTQRGPLFERVVACVNRYRNDPIRVAEQVYMSCGLYESLIYENRSMAPLLREAGMRVRFTETPDGHNWENWRDRLREGLSWLFPGPQMMIYE